MSEQRPVVLVAHGDAVVARFIESNLRLEGFDVRIAPDGDAALAAVAAHRPDLVLVDAELPVVDGIELCRRLRATAASASVPLLLLGARDVSTDAVLALAAGADDFVLQPFDTLELVARVHAALRRHREARGVSPLTGLPGNHRIDEEIAGRFAAGRAFAVCYVDLDHFKSFNDRYGFLRGDSMLQALADALAAAAIEGGPPMAFVGHVGGDDFVVVCEPMQAEIVAKAALTRFDAVCPSLYDEADAVHGHLLVTDRRGEPQRYPLVSVSMGIAISGGRRGFRDHREVVAVATEMKSVAKRDPGSTIAVDRRVDGA